MAFVKKTWLARLGQGLNKFILNGGSRVTLESSPDTVTQQGTPLSAENMNDLEQRIADEFSNQTDAINAIRTSFIPFKMSECDDLDTNRIVSEKDKFTVHFYYFSGYATGTKPFGDGYLIEFSWAYTDGGYTTQIAFEDAGQKIAMRSRKNDLTWETWKFVTLT